MLVAIIVMWLSTVAFWIVTLVTAVKAWSVLRDLTAQTLGQIANMQACLYSMTSTGATYGCSPQNLRTELADTEAYAAEDCAGTVSLAINVCLPACYPLHNITRLPSPHSEPGRYWRFNCVVAGMGALAGQPRRSLGWRHYDRSHDECALYICPRPLTC